MIIAVYYEKLRVYKMKNMQTQNLTNNEKLILKTLLTKDKFSPEDLSKKSGLNNEVSMQSAFLLAEKGLCDIQETVTEIYKLTKEGELYAEISLPERQIINFITSPVSLSDLKKKFPPKMVGIALGWMRKKKWAKIEEDMIFPEGKAGIEEDEVILSKLKNGPLSDLHDAVKDLIKRNLVEKTEKKSRIITINVSGMALSSAGLTIEEEIAQLTQTIITSGSWKNAHILPYDIHTLIKPVYGAKLHPYHRLINEMLQIFLEMSFTEIKATSSRALSGILMPFSSFRTILRGRCRILSILQLNATLLKDISNQ